MNVDDGKFRNDRLLVALQVGVIGKEADVTGMGKQVRKREKGVLRGRKWQAN